MVDLEGVNSLEWQLHGEARLKVSDGFRWTIRCLTLGLPISLHSGYCCLLWNWNIFVPCHCCFLSELELGWTIFVAIGAPPFCYFSPLCFFLDFLHLVFFFLFSSVAVARGSQTFICEGVTPQVRPKCCWL